jgi:hypothetical protein
MFLIWRAVGPPADPSSIRIVTSIMATNRLSQLQNHLSPSSDLVLTSYSPGGRVVAITISNAARANCLSTNVLKALLAAFSSINPNITLDSSVDTEDPIAFAERVCQTLSPRSSYSDPQGKYSVPVMTYENSTQQMVIIRPSTIFSNYAIL